MINQQISKDINQFIGNHYQNRLSLTHQSNSFSSSSSPSQVISNNKQILPSYTEIHVTSPSAAGIPVLEVVKRLEEEKLITKEDRMGLQDALYSSDVVRREDIVKSLCDVELSMNSRFAIRRLKAVIHQNGGGEISSKYRTNSSSSVGDDSSRVMNANVVGLVPPLVLKIVSSKSNARKIIKPTNSSLETISPPKESSASARLSTEIINSLGNNHYVVGAGNKLYIDPGKIKDSSNSNNQQISNLTGNNISIVNSSIEHQSGMQIKVSARSNVSYGTVNNNVYNSSSKPSPITIVDYTSTINNNSLLLSGNSGKQQQSKLKYYNSIEPIKLIAQSGNDDDLLENMNTQNAIHQVVGKSPLYSAPGDNFNVLSKISIRLQAFYDKYDASKMGSRRFAVLVGGGSYNPLTRMHLRTYFLAKQYLESRLGYIVLGSLLSPAHGVTVRERYRTNPSEILPSPHRLAVAQLLVQNSKLLSIDPWEITRRRAMDYLSLLEHTRSILKEQFPGIEIKIMFVCKPNMVPKLSPQSLKSLNFSVISVCRTPESDTLRNFLGAKWNSVINIVDDTAILDASLDVVTSRKVRDKIKAGESIEQLVGEKINDYILIHRIGAKMSGIEKWEPEERILPTIASRPAGPVLTSQISLQLQQQSSIYSGSNASINSKQCDFESINNNYIMEQQQQSYKYAPLNSITEIDDTQHQQQQPWKKKNVISEDNNNKYTPTWLQKT